jgi:rRNA-processing protein FCF1
VHVPEPSVEETYQILLGLRERYEAHHKLRYTDEALESAAKYSSQYISDRFLPDKVRPQHLPAASAGCHQGLVVWCVVLGYTGTS